MHNSNYFTYNTFTNLHDITEDKYMFNAIFTESTKVARADAPVGIVALRLISKVNYNVGKDTRRKDWEKAIIPSIEEFIDYTFNIEISLEDVNDVLQTGMPATQKAWILNHEPHRYRLC